MALFLIYGIFFIAFFANSLVGYNFIPAHVTIVTELCIYLLFLYSLVVSRGNHQDYCLHLVPLFTFFLLVALCSIVVNNAFTFRPIFSLRLMLRFFIFYLALINLGLNNDQLKKINGLLFILFIIQLPSVAIKFYFLGFSEETIGTYGVKGGGLTPIIPIIALGYLTGYYVFHKARKVYILLGMGFVLMGIVGVKAALLFLYPATFLGLYYLLFIKERRFSFAKKIPMLTLVVLLSAGVGAAVISVSTRLNPEKIAGGGSINFFYALEHAKEYTIGGTYDGKYGGGRVATTIIALDTALKEGLGHFIFGYGPGSLTESILSLSQSPDSRIIRIAGSYGITGMAYVLIEYGMFGVIALGSIFWIFARMSWKWYNNEIEPYWKAFSFGTFVFAFLYAFIFFVYNKAFAGDTLPVVYFYVMAVMYLRSKETLQEEIIRPQS